MLHYRPEGVEHRPGVNITYTRKSLAVALRVGDRVMGLRVRPFQAPRLLPRWYRITHDTTESFYHASPEARKLLNEMCVRPTDTEEQIIERLIEERRRARSAKQYARADEIRMALKSVGVVLEDRRDGTDWRRDRFEDG